MPEPGGKGPVAGKALAAGRFRETIEFSEPREFGALAFGLSVSADANRNGLKMKRRAFLGSVALGLLTTPSEGHAQQASKVYRIGYLAPGRLDRIAHIVEAFDE